MSSPAPESAGAILVQPTLEDVARSTALLRTILPAQLGEDECYSVEIGLAEALTNVVLHGYAGLEAEPFKVRWSVSRRMLLLEIRDRGRPIPKDRLRSAGPDTFSFDPTVLDTLPEGGLGLSLMMAAFDRVDYSSAGGVNCLRLTKRIS